MFRPSARSSKPTMPSADFCQPIPAPCDTGSTRQIGRSPRVMRTHLRAYAHCIYDRTFRVQVPGFEDIGLLSQYGRLVCDFCSSGRCFVTPWRDFLRIPPHGRHPCRPANTSPCRVCRGLDFDKLGQVAPPSECALPGARSKRPTTECGSRPFLHYFKLIGRYRCYLLHILREHRGD